VRCWGLPTALGDPNQTDPKQPSTTGLANIVSVVTGSQHACALDGTGTVSCWGYNDVGELGNGDTANRLAPTPVKGGSGVLSIGSGNRHTCAVLTDRTVRCWGSNEFGGLGDGTTTDSTLPVAVRLGPGTGG
jgi:alpha-tubulin suppressor-like RCC1 family protein